LRVLLTRARNLTHSTRYAAFREAAELLEFVVGGVFVEAAEAAVVVLEAAAAAARGGEGGERGAGEAAAGEVKQQEGGGGAGERGAASGGAGAADEAWQAAWQAVEVVVAPLRRTRALVAGGGDAAAAADVLLERAVRAMPFSFSYIGGQAHCATLTGGGGVECTKQTYPKYVHAASASTARSATWRLRLGRDLRGQYIGLVAPAKDLTKNNDIRGDRDVWLLDTHSGVLHSNGKQRRANPGGKMSPGDVVELNYDAAGATLSFLRGGEVVGCHTRVASNPKLVISMACVGNGAECI
jgi:hypothetical protein